jgi:hypothetical protein
LQGVEAVAALRGFVQVVLHLAHCAVDFLFVCRIVSFSASVST